MTEPNKKRFEEYIQLQDGSGFVLNDGSKFQFDKYGGWYDEYNNYYNKNGSPCSSPAQQYQSQNSEDQFQQTQYVDPLIQTYEQQDDDYIDQNQNTKYHIEQQKIKLMQYMEDIPIKIFFKNAPEKIDGSSLASIITKKTNVPIEYYYKKQSDGYLMIKGQLNSCKIIQNQKMNIQGKKLSFSVQNFQDMISNPHQCQIKFKEKKLKQEQKQKYDNKKQEKIKQKMKEEKIKKQKEKQFYQFYICFKNKKNIVSPKQLKQIILDSTKISLEDQNFVKKFKNQNGELVLVFKLKKNKIFQLYVILNMTTYM